MKITIFSEELRKCLNAAGLSDCGENDTWNYWYQRLMNAYNESVERQIMTEQAENAKLRELVRKMMQFFEDGDWCTTCECVQECDAQEQYEEDCLMRGVFHDRMRELRVEVTE